MAVILQYRPPPLGEHPRASDRSLAGLEPQGLSVQQFNDIASRCGLDGVEDRKALEVYLSNFNSIRSHFVEAPHFGIQS